MIVRVTKIDEKPEIKVNDDEGKKANDEDETLTPANRVIGVKALQHGIPANFISTFNKATRAYCDGKWDEAKKYLEEVRSIVPKDKVVTLPSRYVVFILSLSSICSQSCTFPPFRSPLMCSCPSWEDTTSLPPATGKDSEHLQANRFVQLVGLTLSIFCNFFFLGKAIYPGRSKAPGSGRRILMRVPPSDMYEYEPYVVAHRS